MRYLTLTRLSESATKNTVLNIYIEDPSATDAVVNKIPCRLLGIIRDGEQKVLAISDDPSKLYVTENKERVILESEYYPIPAGAVNVAASGSYKGSKFSGMNFEFHGVTDRKVLKVRNSKASRCVLSLMLSAVILFFSVFTATKFLMLTVNRSPFIENGDENSEQKIPLPSEKTEDTLEEELTPEKNNQKLFNTYPFSINLTTDFTEKTATGNYFAMYDSAECMVWVMRMSYSDIDSKYLGYSLPELCEDHLAKNSVSEYDADYWGDKYFARYTVDYVDSTLLYYSIFIESSTAFWRVDVMAFDSYADYIDENVFAWIESIVIA